MQLVKSEGFFGGVYKGMLSLLCRDVPAWGVYFSCYEVLKDQFKMGEAKKNGTDNSTLNIMIKMWCAGVAGQASWTVSYPFDTIKTQIQCTVNRRVSIREAASRIYAAEGAQGFFKGLSPTLSRAFIVNCVTLPTFEYLNARYCYGSTEAACNGARR